MVDGEAGEYRTFTELLEQLRQEGPNGEIFEFLQLVATCHTVIPEIKEVDGEMVMEYQASSPDEEALVKGVAEFGFKFNVRKPKTIVVNVLGQDLEYQVLNVNEFNSTRKRMSAILRMPDGTIKLYCKGADTVIFERLAEHSRENVGKTVSHLEEFASEGLRTLCLSSRVISEQEYQNWSQIYSTAATTLKNRQEALDNAAELIEKDMVLVGATAIEDKLQEGVPRTIAMLAQAGIKIWVLTGDRQETAINIGYSCKLLQEDYSLVICNTNTHWETKQFLNQKLVAIRESRGTSTIDFDSMALVIDGRSLDFALEKDVENVFLDLATVCKAVICCRVSPLQKALVVRLVKRKRRAVLLAIGDGANDVSMIQAAHVGVGISGQEGLQAARAADFAISEFQHLRKLLLVHGAWSYNRLSKMILYSFYKNILLYMTQFFFAFYNMFTGQTLYESWSITFYSVFFSLMPPFAIGIFDQFLSARSLERYPEMYKMSQLGEFFNVRAFWGSTINAFVHSATIFFLSLAFLNPIITSAGYSADLWTLGVTLYTCAIITVLLKASLLVYTWNKWTLVSIPGSLVLWFLFFPLYSYLGYYLNLGYVYYGLFPITMGTLGFWLSAIISPLLCMVRDFAWKYYKRMYGTRAYQIVQEIQKFNIPDYRPRMERFRKAVHKARTLQRLKRNRGYAFSQTETGQAKIIRSYDTTKRKPTGV
ncbi:putative phospholipid-transporting ATPase DRS2 [Zancudomyces culisetae]|uniref:Phospholipid-transporting ATPase n=1 Tax=Zancudomyces culisetae TaxID=1213189 RepID=A0A1R1PLH4_ZANCU|nr:putative phospholipid-transporting ATPase DRS2 [Zancudomyces culisetae]|eukprot:OMH81722.1 putative phospholipid-transporting ATPase DRS2 [Zancudomyces culisetae]